VISTDKYENVENECVRGDRSLNVTCLSALSPVHKAPSIGPITCRRGAFRLASSYDPLDWSRFVARWNRAPEAIGCRGHSKPADRTTRKGWNRALEPARGQSRPADRPVHSGRNRPLDAVRSPAANHNRDPRSAKPGRTPPAAVGGGRARRSREPPAVRCHTDRTQPPGAALVRHYNIGEAPLAPEQ
jgi:hypothetical protein